MRSQLFSHFYFATTDGRKATLQKYASEIEENGLGLTIYSWSDINFDLNDPQYQSVVKKHYKNFIISIPEGDSSSKLIILELPNASTRVELVLVKLPIYEGKFNGNLLVVNPYENKLTPYRLGMPWQDLRNAFDDYEAFAIAKFLN